MPGHNGGNGADPASPLLSDGYTVYTPGLSERPIGGASVFYHQDSLGNTVATTDASGFLTSDQRFDAFGNPSWYVKSPTVFGFGGKHQYQTDAESGLLLLGHRYYDPSVGRFISQDPAQDTSNWYAYCGNNPLVAVDPTGLVQQSSSGDRPWWETAIQVTGEVVGAGVAMAGTAAAMGGGTVASGGTALAAAPAAPAALAAAGGLGAVAGKGAADLCFCQPALAHFDGESWPTPNVCLV